MKPHNYILIVLSACLLCSCAGQSNPYALDVPDKVTVVKTDKHIRIKGTCIFIVPPEGYVQAPMKCALTYKDSWYIHFGESDRHINDFIDSILKNNTESNQYKYYKSIEYRENKALIINEENFLAFVFGNQRRTATISCIYLTEDRAWRDTLVKSILTAYIDTSYRALAMKDWACYTIDTSDTDFKLAHYSNGFYCYTLGGKRITEKPDIDRFMIMPLPYNDPGELVEFGIKSDTTIRAYNIRKTEVNGFPAVEYYCEGFLSGDYKMYSVIFGNGKTSLNCGGMIYDMEQYDEYMDEFKKIIKTIRFKEE